MKGQFNREIFELIERTRNGMSVFELVRLTGMSKKSAATWLSKWTNYYNKARNIHQQFLIYENGRYKIGKDWWFERVRNSTAAMELFHDVHDMSNSAIRDHERYGIPMKPDPPGRKPISADTVDLMRKLRAKGMSYRQVGELVGVSDTTVSNYTKPRRAKAKHE